MIKPLDFVTRFLRRATRKSAYESSHWQHGKYPSGYWVEITTERPCCTYYFGPFEDWAEAEAACPGYVEDLLGEGAEGIHSKIDYCKPAEITIENG